MGYCCPRQQNKMGYVVPEMGQTLWSWSSDMQFQDSCEDEEGSALVWWWKNNSYSGVALMLSDRIAKCVMHSGNYGSRIVYMTIRSEPCNIFVVGLYMPQSRRKEKPFAADTIKQLEELMSQVGPHTCIMILGDLNCKLGRNIDNLTGRWCIHEKSNKEGTQWALNVESTLNKRWNLVATLFNQNSTLNQR